MIDKIGAIALRVKAQGKASRSAHFQQITSIPSADAAADAAETPAALTMHLFRRGTSSLFSSSNVSLASSKTDTDTDAVGDNALAAEGFKSVAASDKLFTKPDPAVDGEECLHDCATCTVKYPAKFDVDFKDELYGQVKGWATHLLVATGKSDWVRDVADEKGSVMEAIEKGGVEPSNGVGTTPYYTCI